MTQGHVFFERFSNRLTITGRLVALTGLRIGAGRSTNPVGSDLPVIRDALNHPYIPGSSFKGVLRTSVESFLRAVAGEKHGACYPVGNEQQRCLNDSALTTIRTEAKDDAELAQNLWDGSCLACRTFGAQWLASHVYVSDLAVDPELWAGQFEVRNGVSIDRDTETAKEGLLYAFETVPAGTAFHCRIETENMATWQLGLLALALRPFLRGEATIGGAASRGLGRVQLDQPELRYFALDNEDPVTQIIDYLSNGAIGELVDEAKQKAWIAELRTTLSQARQSSAPKEAS